MNIHPAAAAAAASLPTRSGFLDVAASLQNRRSGKPRWHKVSPNLSAAAAAVGHGHRRAAVAQEVIHINNFLPLENVSPFDHSGMEIPSTILGTEREGA